MTDFFEHQSVSMPWWGAEAKGKRHQTLMDTFKFIQERDTGRREEDLRNLRIYSNRNVVGVGPTSHSVIDPFNNTRMAINATKSVCDAATAKVAKNRPKPVFLTSGGSYSHQKRAKNLEKYVDLVFYRSKLHEIGPRVFQDATIQGTGFVNVFIANDEIKIERVWPGEIVVDQAEAMYGDPRTIYRQTFVNRDVLKALFPEKATIIDTADRVPYDHYRNYPTHDTTADQLLVVSAWHLPSSPTSGDGMYSVVIDETTLEEKEWKHDWFPFVPLRWTDRQLGYFGGGIVEEVAPIQTEINVLTAVIQKSMKWSVPWVLVEANSKIQAATINNDIGNIIPYKGSPPIVRPNSTVAPEMFEHLRFLISQVYQIPGVSEAMATGQKPGSISSGVGIREVSDRESTRFAIVAQAYEQMFLEVAKRVVTFGKQLNKKVVLQRDKYTVEQVDWSEVEIPEDEYVLKVYPSSALPDDPAGRLDMVQEMIQGQLVSPQAGKRLLDFPDLEAQNRLDQAAHDFVSKILEKMISKGEYTSPEPFMDLNLAKLMAMAEYNRASQFDDIPDEHLQLLRNFMMQIHELQKKAALELQRAQAPQVDPAQSITAAPSPVNPDGSQPGAVGSADVMTVQ